MLPDKETRDIRAYLNNTLPPNRRENFELRLLNEPDFKARFEELKPILETIEDIRWEKRVQEIIKSNIEEPPLSEPNSPGTIKVSFWQKLKPTVRYAAAACVVLMLGFIGYQNNHEKDYNNSRADKDLEQSKESEKYNLKGDVGNNCPDEKTLNIYISGNYDLFFKTISKQSESSCFAYYKGMCLLRMNSSENAIPFLEKVEKATDIDENYIKDSAEWHLCLAYLKNNDKKEAIDELNKILQTPDHQFQNQAKSLLDSLKKEYILFDLRF
jgi:hypothetical protein